MHTRFILTTSEPVSKRPMTDHSAPIPPSSLPPIFGTRCRTQAFSYNHPNSGTAQHVHFVAFRDTANGDHWTVQRITLTSNAKTGEAWVKADTLTQRIGFSDALTLLSQYESYHRDNKLGFTALFPDAPAMGFDHYRAFAEREGYVFDRIGRAYERPALGELPGGVDFDAAAIASANKNCQRPANEFGPRAPSRQLPDTLFLFDAFNRKAIGKKQSSELASLRVLNLMDTFVKHIDAYNMHLTAYSKDYLRTGGGGRITAAEHALTQAKHQLRQMAAYGVDVSAFEKMTQECAIITCVVHAQGIYDLLRRQLGNFEELETQFKRRAGEALTLYQAFEKGDTAKFAQGYTALQEMMIQGGTPAIPATIATFVEKYHQQRALMIAPPATGNGTPPAKPPSP